MVIQLNLPAQLEERLKSEASRRGLAPDACALQTLDQHLPATAERQTAALAMLEQWNAQDAALSPEESAENEAVLRALDEDRPSYRRLFTEVLKETR
jgi:hypothetical protein